MKTKAPLFILLLLGLLNACRTPSTAPSSWKFVIAGDSRGRDNGVNTAILGEIVQETIEQNAGFILFPGDLVTGSAETAELESQLLTWQQTMQPLYDAGIAVYPVRGNHETGPSNAEETWNKVFSGKYALPQNGPAGEAGMTYSVSHGKVFILALDQYIEKRRVNQRWAESQLKANTQPIIIALGHEPAFKLRHADCLDDYPVQRDAFWESLQQAGCRHYACGHDHFFDYARIDDGDGDPSNDVGQYVVGTAGAPIYPGDFNYDGENSTYRVNQIHHADQYGYLLAEVNGSNVAMIWYERDPNTGKYSPAWKSSTTNHEAN